MQHALRRPVSHPARIDLLGSRRPSATVTSQFTGISGSNSPATRPRLTTRPIRSAIGMCRRRSAAGLKGTANPLHKRLVSSRGNDQTPSTRKRLARSTRCAARSLIRPASTSSAAACPSAIVTVTSQSTGNVRSNSPVS